MTSKDELDSSSKQELGHVGYDELCYSKYKRLNNKIDERQFANAHEPITISQLASTTSPSRTSGRKSSQAQNHSDASRSSTPSNRAVISPGWNSDSSPKKSNITSQNHGNAQENKNSSTADQKPLPLSLSRKQKIRENNIINSRVAYLNGEKLLKLSSNELDGDKLGLKIEECVLEIG
nr:unnamed protein product [Callosobruchus chinensis]